MRAPLFLLTTTAIALAATTAACFDWDDLLGRCQDAGNCLPPDRADSGDGGDGGDGGGGTNDAGRDGGGDAGQDGGGGGSDGGDGGGGGPGSRGTNCTSPSECVTGLCAGFFCACTFDGGCWDDGDCCLGSHCSAIPPTMGTCLTDAISLCSGATSPCPGPGGCCSTCNVGSGMCDCSPSGVPCSLASDCCNTSAVCSQGKHCCNLPAMGCGGDDQCCSRVCVNNVCK